MHQFGAGTHIGNLREHNEDSYVCDAENALWIVADGMGALGSGEAASAIATFTITNMIRDGHGVNQAIEVAHSRIREYAESDGHGKNMGTTLVLLLSQGSLYNVYWVGDSRAYLLSNKDFKQITIDHTLVQSLIYQGELTIEEAAADPRKNAVTMALGVHELENVRADSHSEKWVPGDKILLCSDGLTDCLTREHIENILRQEGSDQELTDQLIKAVLDEGGKNNVTIVLVSAPDSTQLTDRETNAPNSIRNNKAPSQNRNVTQNTNIIDRRGSGS